MFSTLLEPISKYVEAAAHLAALQTIGAINAERRRQINEAGRAANKALTDLSLALLEADINHSQRDVATNQWVRSLFIGNPPEFSGSPPDATSAAVTNDS